MELLGSGTFGRAWLVKNNATGKNYVCKEVTVSGMTEKAKEQSLTEVAALAKCKHLNVIRYRQAFVDKGMLNIVMEYADAGKNIQILCMYWLWILDEKVVSCEKNLYLPRGLPVFTR